jgi:hypothetical protein
MSAHNHLQEAMIAEYEIPATVTGEAIVPDRSPAICVIKTGAGAQTRTLPSPLNPGQELTIIMDTDGGGDCVVTSAAAINQAGNTIITLGDAGDMIRLAAATVGGVNLWRVVANDGAVLS